MPDGLVAGAVVVGAVVAGAGVLAADFFDAFLVGDAEEALPIFLDAYRNAGASALSRRDLLAALHGSFTEGFDTPDLRDATALLKELA